MALPYPGFSLAPPNTDAYKCGQNFDYLYALGSNGSIILDAVGDGITDDTAAIESWINQCSVTGRPGLALPGVYLVTTAAVTIDNDVELVFVPGASIKGASGLSTTVLTINGGITRPSLNIQGLIIDNSLRIHVVGTNSGTALLLNFIGLYTIQNSRFLSTDDYRDDMGDSGIVLVECGPGIIDNCYFRGQPDAGVYLSGGSSTSDSDDYGDAIVTNCYFLHCANAATFKRAIQRTIFTENRVFECRSGFSAEEADSSGVTLYPGRGAIFSNNEFKRIGSRAVTARYGPCIAIGNVIEDWGHDRDDVLIPSQPAILWNTSGSLCNSNVMRFRDWSGLTQIGIRVDVHTITGATGGDKLIPTDNQFDNNIVDGASIGIGEYGAGADRNHGLLRAIGVTTPFDKPNFNSTSSFTVIEQ